LIESSAAWIWICDREYLPPEGKGLESLVGEVEEGGSGMEGEGKTAEQGARRKGKSTVGEQGSARGAVKKDLPPTDQVEVGSIEGEGLEEEVEAADGLHKKRFEEDYESGGDESDFHQDEDHEDEEEAWLPSDEPIRPDGDSIVEFGG
jgi:hypothetical protein